MGYSRRQKGHGICHPHRRDNESVGGQVAGNDRKEIETKAGRPVITKQSAIDFTNVIELVGEIEKGDSQS